MNLKLTPQKTRMLLVYLDLAYEMAVHYQFPQSQDGIKDMIKYIKSQKKGKKS